MNEILKKFVQMVEDVAESIKWKFHLFATCVKMDVKNARLKRSISAEKKRAAKYRRKLSEMRGENR